MGKTDKVIFDTNVWISLFLKRALAQEFSETINKQVTLFISQEILVEISRVLTCPKIRRILDSSETNTKQILRFIAENTIIVDPKIKVKLINEDPQDNKILECALAADADYIVTGDSHLLKVGKFKQTTILTPRAFLDYYSAK